MVYTRLTQENHKRWLLETHGITAYPIGTVHVKQSVFLRAIVKSKHDCVALKNTAGMYLACSEPYAMLLGQSSSSEVIGRTDKALRPNAELTDQLTLDVQTLTSGAYSLFTYDNSGLNPSSVSTRAITRIPIRNGSGKIVGVSVRVISPLNSPDEHDEEHNTLEKVLSAGKYGHIVFSSKGILFVDDNAARTLGHTRRDSKSGVTPLRNIISLTQLKQLEDALTHQTTAKHTSKSLTVTLNRTDHRQLRVSIKGVPVNWGFTEAYLLAFVDAKPLDTSTTLTTPATKRTELPNIAKPTAEHSSPTANTSHSPLIEKNKSHNLDSSEYTDVDSDWDLNWDSDSDAIIKTFEHDANETDVTRTQAGFMQGVRRELSYVWTGMESALTRTFSALGFLFSVLVLIVLLCNVILLTLIAVIEPSAINRWTVVWHENLIASPLLAIACVAMGFILLLRSRGRRKQLLRLY